MSGKEWLDEPLLGCSNWSCCISAAAPALLSATQQQPEPLQQHSAHTVCSEVKVSIKGWGGVHVGAERKVKQPQFQPTDQGVHAETLPGSHPALKTNALVWLWVTQGGVTCLGDLYPNQS